MNSTTSLQSCEARFDPFSDKVVLVAPKRSKRPNGSPASSGDRKLQSPPPAVSSACPPDCPGGHEDLTPPAVYVCPESAALNAPGWTIRVVPNKFSCFSRAGSNLHYELPGGLRGIEDPAGACEVVFETEHHKHPIHSRSPEEMAFCIRAIVNRYQTARLDPQARFWYGFKNLGKAAGGTIDHEHWQLYTFSFVPPAIQERYERAAQYFNRTGRSLYGDRFAAEVASGERIVAASPHFLTFVPFAAGMPYQIRIVPKRHTADFSRMTGDQLIDFGVSLRDAVARLCGVIPDLAFNIELHTAAFEHASAPWFCWHLEIVPRITTLAGVELGLNVMVNPVLPEEAASKLRAVSVG